MRRCTMLKRTGSAAGRVRFKLARGLPQSCLGRAPPGCFGSMMMSFPLRCFLKRPTRPLKVALPPGRGLGFPPAALHDVVVRCFWWLVGLRVDRTNERANARGSGLVFGCGMNERCRVLLGVGSNERTNASYPLVCGCRTNERTLVTRWFGAVGRTNERARACGCLRGVVSVGLGFSQKNGIIIFWLGKAWGTIG